ncbi:MAG: hypothetical protein ACYC35_16265 [Pirellulales bacterium]
MKCTPTARKNPEANLPATSAAPAGVPPTVNRLQIIVDGEHADRTAIVDQAAAALASVSELFQRDGKLVEWIFPPSPASPWVHAIGSPRLRELLASAATWLERGRGGRLRAIHPKGWAVTAVLRRGCWPGIRAIESAEAGQVAR